MGSQKVHEMADLFALRTLSCGWGRCVAHELTAHAPQQAVRCVCKQHKEDLADIVQVILHTQRYTEIWSYSIPHASREARLTTDFSSPPRIAIVCPVLANHDAIAASARDTYRALSREPGFEVGVLTFRNDYCDVPVRTVSGLVDLLLDPIFQAADVIIYHFGIYCDLFDALIAAKGRAMQIVRFHNVTPPQYMKLDHQDLIERSFRQMHNLSYADEIWADSSVNAETLAHIGINWASIRVIPLSVEDPKPCTLCGKVGAPLKLLFVGRFVQSKGVLDLIEAVELVRTKCDVPFQVRLAGNMEWSDQRYLARVKEAINARELDNTVHMMGTVTAEVMQDLYHSSHILVIPSYHEGFCKPVIEGLRAGCVPVGYAAHNLPTISNGLGRLVQPGDIYALASALQEVIEGIARSPGALDDPMLPLDRGKTSIYAFDNAAHRYVQSFSFEGLASATLERIRALCAIS
jgi:glycosyltransferase involved in cell wall biosynthesis